MDRQKKQPLWAAIPAQALLIVLAALVLLPLLWLVLSAFKPEKEIVSWPPTFWFRTFTLEHFATVDKRIDITRYLLNSVIFACGTTSLAVVVNSLAGYAYARMQFKGKNFLFLLTLATMMIPFQVIMVPSFLVVYKMGLYNTYLGLILPRVAVAASIFMMRAAFSGIPKELDEAAEIDGASRMRTLWTIIVPAIRPAITVVILMLFIQLWNDLLQQLIYINDMTKTTFAIGLTNFTGSFGTKWNYAMAATCMTIAPGLVIYIIGQKSFVEGIVLTGMKN